jgi:1-acyl-sn-glycerol-3-phosphate acyltransferase
VADDPAGTVSVPRQLGRLVALLAVLAGLALLLPLLPLVGADRRYRLARGGARAVLRAVGIRAIRRGVLPTRRALIVANHVSWLDIVAMLAVHRVRLVAKCEVARWPVIGGFARRTGAIFLDRTRPSTLPAAVASAANALAGGDVVAVFPEATTSCGRETGGFRPAFFQAALDAGAAVVPVTLRFEVAGERTTAPAFLGAETLIVSLRRVLALRGLTIRLSAGTAIHPDPAACRQEAAGRVAARQLLARMARAAMGSAGTSTGPRPAPSLVRPAASAAGEALVAGDLRRDDRGISAQLRQAA